jgi:hypothetical protein
VFSMNAIKVLGLLGIALVAWLACNLRTERALVFAFQMMSESAISERIARANEAYFEAGGEIAVWELNKFSMYLDKELVRGRLDERRINYLLVKTHVRLADLFREQGDHERAAIHTNQMLAAALHVFGETATHPAGIFEGVRTADAMERECNGEGVESQYSTKMLTISLSLETTGAWPDL